MSNHSTSSKAGNEASHQPAPSHQNKEADHAPSQSKATGAGKHIGFDFGEMPVFPPSRQNPNLPGELQANLETSFGQDFSRVNIHRSSQAAQRINALAYTQGEIIHFAPGEFNPHSESGRNLIGHEFAHIVQQRSGMVEPTAVLGKGLPLNDNQGLENEADCLGRKAVHGEVVSKYQSPSLGIRNGMRTVQAKRGVVQRAVTTWGGTWDTDQYDLVTPATAAGSRGVDIKLKFSPNTKVNAELIGLTQSVQAIIGGSPRLTPAASTRAIPSGDAINISTGAGETDEGTAIDRASGFNNPIYPVNNPSSTSLDDSSVSAGWGQLGWRYNDSSGALKQQDATLIDAPRRPRAEKNARHIFETTALATKGVQVGTYYGSVRWGWRTDAAGAFTKIPLSVVSQGVPSSTFMKAGQIWNDVKSSTGADSVDLPIVDVKVTTTQITEVLPPLGPSSPPMSRMMRTIPAGTRVQIVFGGQSLQGGGEDLPRIKVIDGPSTGMVISISLADLDNLGDERP
jgi:hypothetical protein